MRFIDTVTALYLGDQHGDAITMHENEELALEDLIDRVGIVPGTSRESTFRALEEQGYIVHMTTLELPVRRTNVQSCVVEVLWNTHPDGSPWEPGQESPRSLYGPFQTLGEADKWIQDRVDDTDVEDFLICEVNNTTDYR